MLYYRQVIMYSNTCKLTSKLSGQHSTNHNHKEVTVVRELDNNGYCVWL